MLRTVNGEHENDDQEAGPTKVDPPEAAGAKRALKVKVGESVGALCSTLVGKE